jgi:glycosyltransferase involved in cell wall biosynthesis
MARLLPRADAILAVSHAVAADLARELELDVRSVEVIHNPIVTREFPRLMQEPILWPWADDLEPTVVFVGRLSPEKRLDLLLDALALLGGDQARLLVLGTGPLEGWLRTEVRIRGLGEKCILVGYQANPLPWIRRSDLLVLQSDYEGFGNVLVEAMACGTQVVATDCPNGPSEILDGGTYGQLVPCGDAAALGAAIRRSLNGVFAVPPAILQERASEFSLERAAQSYRRVMSRLVSPTLG